MFSVFSQVDEYFHDCFFPLNISLSPNIFCISVLKKKPFPTFVISRSMGAPQTKINRCTHCYVFIKINLILYFSIIKKIVLIPNTTTIQYLTSFAISSFLCERLVSFGVLCNGTNVKRSTQELLNCFDVKQKTVI